jgi:TPR repeat protein
MKKIIVVLLVAVSCSAWSGDFEEGVAANEKKDYTKALVHFKAAAAKGNTGAQSNLGVMYEEGYGVEQDI